MQIPYANSKERNWDVSLSRLLLSAASKGRPKREYLGAPEVGSSLQSLLLLVVAGDLFLVAESEEDEREVKGGEKWRKVTKWQKRPSAGKKMKEAGNVHVGCCEGRAAGDMDSQKRKGIMELRRKMYLWQATRWREGAAGCSRKMCLWKDRSCRESENVGYTRKEICRLYKWKGSLWVPYW